MSEKKDKRALREKKAKAPRENGFNRASQGLHGMIVRMTSRVKLSLTYRIAMHYCWQLARTFLSACLLVTLALALSQAPHWDQAAKRAAAIAPGAGGVYTQQEIGDPDVTITAVDAPWPESGFEEAALYVREIWHGLWRAEVCLPVRTAHLPDGYALVAISAAPVYAAWVWLMGAVAAADVLRMLYFLHHSHRLDKRVLTPIRDMTDMAATLSAANLSDRINIAGTKNELRDLAVVINTMLDRIERSYNSQKQFVSDASHELRTPIAVIQGYVNMLGRWGKDDPEVLSEGLTAISQETASMKDLVENLLFLARHDKKTLMMEMSAFDPCDILSELHKEAQMVTPDDRFITEPMEHCVITADRNMVKQVMRILLDNAVKYTPAGGTITMGVTREAGGCTLTMRDNGPGIPAEDLPRIFDRFYRADKARKSETGGHGLGLSIARIIVVAHGGKIRVRSKVGEGTTFMVTLPENQSTASGTTQKAADVEA